MTSYDDGTIEYDLFLDGAIIQERISSDDLLAIIRDVLDGADEDARDRYDITEWVDCHRNMSVGEFLKEYS